MVIGPAALQPSRRVAPRDDGAYPAANALAITSRWMSLVPS